MNYYIFRHGETYYSKNHVFYGKAYKSAEILPEGITAIKKIASFLKDKRIDQGFTSPFKRNVQTTNIVRKETGIKFEKDERLGEQLMLYGMESLKQFTSRISNFVEEFESTNYQNIAICSHGWPIAALIALITKGKVSKLDLFFNNPKCGVLIIIKNKQVQILDFNKKNKSNFPIYIVKKIKTLIQDFFVVSTKV